MKLSSIKKISVIGIFVLSFLTHFMYSWFPNSLFSIFFPVNESIWEHMKILYTTILLYGIIDYFILKHYEIKVNNYILSVFLSALLSIPIYLIILLPFFYNGLNNKFVYFLILLITYIICSYISYFILNQREFKYQEIISFIFIIVVYIVLGYLTYHPLKNDLFFDSKEEKYGINEYIL